MGVKASTRAKETAYIRKERRLWARGKGSAHNIACAYRVLGNYRLTFKWCRQAFADGDESSHVELGYCYQHGAGVRRNLKAAARAYKRCIAGYPAEVDREEAMYLLATISLGIGGARHRSTAVRLLRQASVDGDYPEATRLIEQIRRGDLDEICTCRRYLRPMLKKAWCVVHGRLRHRQ